MARHPLLRYLRAAGPATGVTDAELARRYAAGRDEAAFELLVRRHAELVWAACRRVLPRDHQAAEDAFQATFLALARRCGSVRSACAAGWLYRVAVRAALRLRARAPVLAAADRPGPEGDADAVGDAGAVVHQELAALADKYRLPVLLCDLEGLTHAAAADRLGWPVGTVSGRLSVARGLLRTRLVRRGVAPALVAAAVASAGLAPAAVVESSAAFAAGAPAPAAVVSLAEGVLSAMKWAKTKVLAAVFAGAFSIAGAAAVAVSQDRAGPGGAVQPKAGAPAAAEPDPEWNGAVPPSAFPDLKPGRAHPAIAKVQVLKTDTPLRKLQKARLNLLVGEFEAAGHRARSGGGSASEARAYYARLAAAAAEVFDDPAELRPWLEAWVTETKAEERDAEAQSANGAVAAAALSAVRRARLDAEIALAKLAAGK
jgi:RNA polymerase sigma factor (sigma-70 family)